MLIIIGIPAGIALVGVHPVLAAIVGVGMLFSGKAIGYLAGEPKVTISAEVQCCIVNAGVDWTFTLVTCTNAKAIAP